MKVIQHFESDIFQALKLDLNKSDHESFTTEVGYVLKEISFLMKHLSSWSKPKRVSYSTYTHWFEGENRSRALRCYSYNGSVELSLSTCDCTPCRGNRPLEHGCIKAVRIDLNVSSLLANMLRSYFRLNLLRLLKAVLREYSTVKRAV